MLTKGQEKVLELASEIYKKRGMNENLKMIKQVVALTNNAELCCKLACICIDADIEDLKQVV